MSDIEIGLDLGSSSIKIAQLKKNGSKFKLLSFASVASPPGGLLTESQLQLEAVAQTIKKLVKDLKLSSNEVRVSLPESKVFTFVIETPALSEKELASSIRWEAEQYIPVPLDEVTLDYKILTRGKSAEEKNQVFLVGALKRVTEKYQKVLEMAGVIPLSLETDLISASRALSLSVPQLTSIMIVNLGADTTDFSILNNGILLFTRSISTSGSAFTKAIRQELQIAEGQAEEYKKTYGILADKLEGKVAVVLKPLVASIIDEMRKGIAFFNEKNPSGKLQVILLTGGTSLLPGLVSHVAQELGIETQLGNPLNIIEIDQKVASQFNQSQIPVYTVALGLAMREG